MNDQLTAGYTHLFLDRQTDHAYASFRAMLAHGWQGLVVTREYPPRIRERYPEGFDALWLSKRDLADTGITCVHPENIVKVAKVFEDFLTGGDRRIGFLDGIEYLIVQNDFLAVLKFFHMLNEQVAISRGILVVTVHPKAMADRELGLLERECQVHELPEAGPLHIS